MSVRLSAAVAALLLVNLGACRPNVEEAPQPTEFDYGCQPPPPSVFTQSGTDIQTARSEFGKVVIGEVKIITKPEVISLASTAATDARLSNYLQCLSLRRDKFTNAQVAYLQQMFIFAGTKPDAAQFQAWQEQNKFPASDAPASQP